MITNCWVPRQAESGQPAEALLVYGEHLTHETDPHTNIGSCLSALGDCERAELYHRGAIACDPDHLGPRWNLFANQVRMRRYESALDVLDQILARPVLDPEDVDGVHVHRAEMLFALRRYSQALTAINLSFAGEPTDVTRLGVRARVLIELGHHDAARVCIGTLVSVEPDSEVAPVLLERLARTSARAWKD